MQVGGASTIWQWEVMIGHVTAVKGNHLEVAQLISTQISLATASHLVLW